MQQNDLRFLSGRGKERGKAREEEEREEEQRKGENGEGTRKSGGDDKMRETTYR